MVDVLLYGEDISHEKFVTALTERVAVEEGVEVDIRTGSVRGGHGKAITELRDYQRLLQETGGAPDVLVVCIDGNCRGFTTGVQEIDQAIDGAVIPSYVPFVPDPHIESWYLADPAGFKSSIGGGFSLPAQKCERGAYKNVLTQALRTAGEFVLLGGAEFADDIVSGMDLYRASKNCPSLGHAIDGLRAALKQFAL